MMNSGFGREMPRFGQSMFKGVFFTAEAVRKMHCFTELAPAEVAGIGMVAKEGGNLFITDAFTIKQEAGVAHADIDPRALMQFCNAFEERGGDMSELRFQWHSHVRMPAIFSPEDLDTIEGCRGDFRVSLVLNKGGEYECRLDIFRPKRSFMNLPVLVLVVAVPPIRIEHSVITACKQEMEKNVFVSAFDQLTASALDIAARIDGEFVDFSPKEARQTGVMFRGQAWTSVPLEYLPIEKEE